MLAGTHWANYALHRRGVTPDAEDIVHTTMTVVAYLKKYELAEGKLLGDLAEVEALRPLYVRGDVEGGIEAGRRALQLLAAIGERARKREYAGATSGKCQNNIPGRTTCSD